MTFIDDTFVQLLTLLNTFFFIVVFVRVVNNMIKDFLNSFFSPLHDLEYYE